MFQVSTSWIFVWVLSMPLWAMVTINFSFAVFWWWDIQWLNSLSKFPIHLHWTLLLIYHVIDSHIYLTPHMQSRSLFLKVNTIFLAVCLFLSLFIYLVNIPLFSPCYFSFYFPSFESHLLSHRLSVCVVIVCCIHSLLLP